MLDAPRALNVEVAELVDVPAVHEVRAAAGAEAPVLVDEAPAVAALVLYGTYIINSFIVRPRGSEKATIRIASKAPPPGVFYTGRLQTTSGAAYRNLFIQLKDGAPNGYIVIDASCPNGIAEFSFEQGSISPYAAALMSNESLASAQHLSEDEQYAVKIDGLLYGAADRSGGPVLLNDGTIADIPMALSSVTGNGWIDATINTSDLYANYAMTAFKFFPSFIGSSQNRITYLTGRYACQVSALCACAGLYGMFDIWDCADEYLEMWDRTGTTVLEVKNGITFGTTNIGKGAVGFGDFCSARGKSISNRVNRSPTFAQYVLAVNAQQTSLFTAWPDPVGHSVAVEGYVSATNNSTGAALSVIVVADGWGDSARYLNFNYPALSNSTGTFFF